MRIYLGEAFFRSGGVPAIMGELFEAGLLHTDTITVNGKSIGENVENHDIHIQTIDR